MAPTVKNADQIPTASPSCRGWTNIVRINPRVDGPSVAPAIPSRARAAISISALLA
jgi:hypothetical protein